MSITRAILSRCDKLFVESLGEPDERKSMRKASVSGFVEGLVDGAVIMYPFLLVACWVYKHKLDNK